MFLLFTFDKELFANNIILLSRIPNKLCQKTIQILFAEVCLLKFKKINLTLKDIWFEGKQIIGQLTNIVKIYEG